MNAWANFWAGVLVTALVLFSCLTVAVTIGGWIDIRKMIRQLRKQHREDQQ